MFDVSQNWADLCNPECLQMLFKSALIGPLDHIVIYNGLFPKFIPSITNSFVSMFTNANSSAIKKTRPKCNDKERPVDTVYVSICNSKLVKHT